MPSGIQPTLLLAAHEKFDMRCHLKGLSVGERAYPYLARRKEGGANILG